MRLMLNDTRIAFPVLFVPEAYQGKGDPYYSATFIIDPKVTRAFRINDDKTTTPVKLNDVVLQVAREKWGAKAEQMLPSMQAKDKVFFRTTEKRSASGDVYSGFEGMYWISARGKTRPVVLDANRSPLTLDDGKPYAGCYVNVSLDVFTYNKEGVGISASIRGVQFLRDGDAFSGGAPASADEFEDLSSGAASLI